MGEARILKTGDNVTPNEFEFTYTGDYNYKEGASGTIELELLTSGTFTLLKSSPFKPFDLCLVGGGGNGMASSSGGGGGGGYVENMFDVPIELNKAYPIVIGGSAGDTTGFGYTAKAGKTASGTYGGDGGSGGGAGGSYSSSRAGGVGGFNGFDGSDIKESSTVYKGGKGQHTSTKAFGTGRLLAGGGGGNGYPRGSGGPGGGGSGGGNSKGDNGTANTGGGGGGGSQAGLGGSGIVIIRRRWDAELNIITTYNYITNNITTA